MTATAAGYEDDGKYKTISQDPRTTPARLCLFAVRIDMLGCDVISTVILIDSSVVWIGIFFAGMLGFTMFHVEPSWPSPGGVREELTS